MLTPLVSILTPTYNHAHYIADCIKSVQSQSYTNWEMIIVDDGSTDETYSIASKFASDDYRIKVFTQPNQGIYKLAKTYNFALSKSSGKYIAILEGDDVWLPRKLELQIPLIEGDQDAVLSWGIAHAYSTDLMKRYHEISGKKYQRQLVENFPVKSALRVLLFYSHMPALTVVVRKTALQSIGGFVSVAGLPTTDLPTWQELAFLGKFIYIDQPLGYWRTSENQATQMYPVEMMKGVRDLAIKRYSQNKIYFESIGLSEKRINRYFNKRFVVNYHKSGKCYYYRHNFIDAKKQFISSLQVPDYEKLVWKIKSLFWIGKCYLKIYLKKSGKGYR